MDEVLLALLAQLAGFARPGFTVERDEVIVGDRCYTYRGEAYTSLSEIARLITGTRWSGPRFFGLKSRTTRNTQDERA